MNRTVARTLLYPVFRRLRGDRVLSVLADMRRVDRMSPSSVQDYQWAKLKLLLDHVSRHVPYYRRVFKEIGAAPEDIRGPRDLLSFPVLRKQDVRENLKELLAETDHRKRLFPEETGGSTGQNLFFYFDRRAFDARKAAVVRMNEWLDVRIGDRKAALWGSRFRERGIEKTKRAIKGWFDNTMYVSAYRMDAESAERSARRLGAFGPDLLVAYPSALHHFVQLIDPGRLGIRPRAILCSGETLYEWQRTSIEAAFGAPVYDHYGCCEFSAVARECKRRDGLHIAADRVYIEAIPVAGSGPGNGVSELVMTDLDNYGMPFIRYAIEDVGSVTWEPCGCGLGLPRLQSLTGRVYDIVAAPNGNFLDGTFWGHILKEGVERFQVVQEALDAITIAIVPTTEFDEKTRAYVSDKIRGACGPDMKIKFDVRKAIEPTPTGKHRYVISKVTRSAAGDSGA